MKEKRHWKRKNLGEKTGGQENINEISWEGENIGRKDTVEDVIGKKYIYKLSK